MTDNVYCLVKISQKDERIIAAVQFEIKLFDFFYQFKQLTDYIYTDIYCKRSKCIGQTPCSYEHCLVTCMGDRCRGVDLSICNQPLSVWPSIKLSLLENCSKVFLSKNFHLH